MEPYSSKNARFCKDLARILAQTRRPQQSQPTTRRAPSAGRREGRGRLLTGTAYGQGEKPHRGRVSGPSGRRGFSIEHGEGGGAAPHGVAGRNGRVWGCKPRCRAWPGNHTDAAGSAVTVRSADSDSTGGLSAPRPRMGANFNARAKTLGRGGPRQAVAECVRINARRVPRGHALNSAGDTYRPRPVQHWKGTLPVLSTTTNRDLAALPAARRTP